MTNPIAKHTSNLFASRGLDFDAAIAYAKEVIEAMPNETRASAYTALMVVVNTAANVCTQSHGPSPERLALIELIDERIAASASNIDQQIADWMDNNVDHDDLIHDWMSNNLTDEIESVIKNSLTFRVIVD